MKLHIVFFAIVIVIHCQQFEEPPTSFSELPVSSGYPELPSNTKALLCRAANGVPTPVYRWMKNGKFLSASNTTDTVLKIINISPSDAGDYQCVASNRVGSIVSPKATVAVAYMSTFASGPTQQVSVTEGHAVVLPLPPLECYPTPTITWSNGVSSITSDVQQYHITLRNDLVILCANMSRDSGSQYRATGNNSYTSQYTQTPTFQLTVNSAGSSMVDIPAEIVVPPSNTSAVEMVDSSVQLECVANSRPLNFLALSWYKVTLVGSSTNRTRIFADSIKYSLSLYGQVLTIRDPRRDDSGIYQCEAVFSRPGSAPSSAVVALATLTVYVKPTFLSFPPSVLTLDVETSVAVRCVVYGIPAPSVMWLRNAVQLNATNRYSLLSGSVLNITNASSDDSGVFQCFATNNAGQIMASTWIRVTNSVPVISNALHNQSVISGDRVRFECLVAGAPRPTVHWHRVRDGTVESLDGSTGHIQMLDTELIIAAVGVNDTATYVCNATNSVGYDSSSAQLTIILRTEITVPPQSTLAVKGSTISLQCGVTHDESVTVTWSWVAVGSEVTPLPLSRFHILNNGTLTISSVRSPDDIGSYTCFIVSQAGNDSATADVKVIELPFAPTALTATLSSATVNAVDLTWAAGFNGGAEILRYVLYYRTVTIGEGGTPLSGSWLTYDSNIDAAAVSQTVINLRPATSYQFQISAVNEVGEGQPSQPSQIVQLPQQPPSGPPRGVTGIARSNNSIILQWQSPDIYTWNGQLLGYIVRYKLAGYQDSTMYYDNVTTFQDSVIRELAGLIIFQEYQIAVAAYNSRDVGVYSANITVRTSEGRPVKPPTNVSAVAVNSTSIRATWLPPNPQFINGINQGYYVKLSVTVNDSLVVTWFTVASNVSNMLGPQSATLRNLLKFAEYQLALSCFTSAGVGPQSSPSVTVCTMEDVPEAVASMFFTNITDTSLVVVWTPPLHSNGILTGYTLVYMRKHIDISSVSVDVNATIFEYTIAGLAPTTMYTVELSATTRIGSGPKVSANVKSGITPVLPTCPMNLVVSNIQATSVLLQFIAGFDGNTSTMWWITEAQRSTVNSPWFEVDRVADPTAVAVIVHNLRPFSTYRLRLIAVNIVGRSSPSDASRWFDTLQAAPTGPPTTVTVRALNETALLVNWMPLIFDDWNGDGRGYLVRYRPPNVANFTGTVTLTDESANSVQLAGLGRWVEYEVQIASFNEVGASEFSELVFCRTRESVPSAAPSDVSSVAINSTAIQVSWLTVLPALQNGLILGYKVFCQPFGNNQSSPMVLVAGDSNVTTVNVTNLQKYVYYSVQVLAFTAVGDGVISFPAVNVRTFEDVPGPPSSVYFPIVSLTTVRVVWSLPLEPNGVITGYNVAYGLTSPPTTVNNSLSSLQHDYFASALEPYRYYVFAVTARTRCGWGQSAILKVYTVTDRTVPQAPSRPMAGQSQVGARWVTISWSPGDDGFGPIRNYTVQTKLNDGAFGNIADYVPADVTQFNVTVLRPFSAYRFRVAASNDVGMSTFSVPSEVISTLQAAPESPPTIISIRCVAPTSILVSWMPPANSTWNGLLTGYDVSYRVTSSAIDTDWQVLSVLTASQLSLIIDGLQLFVTYEVKVRAVNPVGSSVYCQPITIYTELAPSGRPQNVQLANVSATSVIMSWRPPTADTWNGNLLGYKVDYWLTSNRTTVTRHVFRAIDTSAVIDNLSPYTQYTLSLLAYNTAGDGPPSGLYTITTAESVPSTPSRLLLIVVSPTTVNVSWSAPLQPNGLIINYELTYQQDTHVDGESKSTTVELAADKTSYAAILLIEEMSYVFSLRARSAPGWGPSRSAGIVIGPQPGCPGTPGRPEFTVSDKMLTLSWSAPLVSESDLPVTGYILQARDKAVSNWESLVTMEKPTTTITVSLFKLKAKSTYQFRVFALNSLGLGSPSDVSADFLQVTDVTAPDKPFYQQWWFLIIVALIGVIVILLVIGVLCITGRNEHSKQKHPSLSLSAMQLNDMQLTAVTNGNYNYDGDVTFPTFELRQSQRKSQRQVTTSNGTLRSHYSRHSSRAPTRAPSRSSRNNTLPTRVRSPPRPSPGSINYNSDDDHKSSADHSSSLSDKASDISSVSAGSDSETESGRAVTGARFKTCYANGDVHDSWARSHRSGVAAAASFNPYSFSDSEHDGSCRQQAVSLNGGHIVINNVAGSRAPLPGFSSFV